MDTYTTVRNINKNQLGWHSKMGGVVLEWLYMDGWMDNGYKYGITLASRIDQGEQFFGEQGKLPFVMIWVTSPEGETLNSVNFFPKEQYKEEKPWGVTIGDNFLRGTLKRDGLPSGYRMKVALDEIGVDITAEAICTGMRFMEEEHGCMLHDQNKNTGIGWWPLVPSASVKGTITFKGKKLQVKGLGYCERQLGNKQEGMGMTDWLHHWYWGHFWAGEYSAVWTYAIGPESRQHHPFCVLVLYKGSDAILGTVCPSISPEVFERDNDTGRHYIAQETIHACEGNTELFVMMSTRAFNEKFISPGGPPDDPYKCFRGYADNIDVEVRRLDRWEKLKGHGFHEQGQMVPWFPFIK